MENPYTPPKAEVDDPKRVIASLSVSGLTRLFQWLVIASTIAGLLLFFSLDLPLPLSELFASALEWHGAGSVEPSVTWLLPWIFEPLWILAAVGMFFFQRWARTLFILLYAMSLPISLIQGVAVLLPRDMIFFTLTTLLDGGIIALAFLPPLSSYFERRAV